MIPNEDSFGITRLNLKSIFNSKLPKALKIRKQNGGSRFAPIITKSSTNEIERNIPDSDKSQKWIKNNYK